MEGQDTTDVAQENDQTDENQETVDTEEAGATEEVGFNEKQLQQMYSATGRIIKKQFDDILPLLQQQTQTQPITHVDTDAEDAALQERLFSGDVKKTILDVVNADKKVADDSKTQHRIATKQAITALSDKPDYKDIYPEIERIATEYAENGYPPEAAADMAYQKARVSHLESKLTGGGQNLQMSSGGRSVPRTKGVKLPPEFQEAAKRDIAKGIFTDEADYIAHLSDGIKAKYNM